MMRWGAKTGLQNTREHRGLRTGFFRPDQHPRFLIRNRDVVAFFTSAHEPGCWRQFAPAFAEQTIIISCLNLAIDSGDLGVYSGVIWLRGAVCKVKAVSAQHRPIVRRRAVRPPKPKRVTGREGALGTGRGGGEKKAGWLGRSICKRLRGLSRSKS